MIGRFAPTPSGPLHFGSLCCALASFLDCRANQGVWRLRIDDIDPPRCVSGSAETIQQQLQDFSLFWDGDITWQSQQLQAYQDQLLRLVNDGAVYRCNCNRKQLQSQNGFELGYCINHPPAANETCALRMNLQGEQSWHDLFLGPQNFDISTHPELCVRRRDGLIGYPLATVLDDISMGITHVIRGADLLPAAASQLALFAYLDYPAPQFGHIPIATNVDGNKLSKQNHAEPLRSANRPQQLRAALAHLGQASSEATGSVEDVIRQAISSWDRSAVPQGR
ncbi:tRNA glutamyl-Q(34) synthetase GluQRS [Umboniibacter marinipuniceus]|uniref:Glutamyl-Q tRNA(Asp) synthetase n=1 Tax=Umboniibacter marinipuniceus TaxID=569599 RepID=A0A3M0A5M8_9GAMM|nr:tRNA glutamyl-Q(34) synthetase GluQRS [Umboniibacter marinipuniceus]RMA80080.1 glutamyl-Q tRNA(Asp) synthetase [Umboniibacter marinipuniceus]